MFAIGPYELLIVAALVAVPVSAAIIIVVVFAVLRGDRDSEQP